MSIKVVRSATFCVNGKITPYVRMTHRGKHKARAQEYLASQEAIAWKLKAQAMRLGWDMVPKDVPLAVGMVFTLTSGLYAGDLSNLEKAMEDAANGIVWHDDRYIAYRLPGLKRLGQRNEAVMFV